jgi:hypothetical protein
METMSAAGDTVELSPSGNHTWFAGKSAFYDFPSKLNLHLWDFPAMFDYQRMIALRLYEYCLVVDEFREKKRCPKKRGIDVLNVGDTLVETQKIH